MLIVLAEVVVLLKLQLILLRALQILGTSLAPLASLLVSGLTVFFIIFGNKRSLRMYDCILWRVDIRVLDSIRTHLILSFESVCSEASLSP